ncbi:flavin monoamine oxidase family protein [Desulfoluna spongiiphila]|uniref:flavin monoamine oxidase family protein n=1 Tax=Desulfoluna spongiiphila TaxID=419481 RepID=UPI00125916EC|nr:NAD(P)/FAD-dependent oxidoreductase [Desulfoluna spongiiphila]VVS94822.1 amine oxidase [Desulfoluna spongiiphila]
MVIEKENVIEKIDTLIIGGGLSGLYAASILAAEKKKVLLLEARDRIGGRILSTQIHGFSTDLGPSWYWPALNPKVCALVNALHLTGYPQFETGYCRFQARDGRVVTMEGQPMDPPGWRIDGGMMALVKGLYKRLPQGTVRLKHPVCDIERRDDGVLVSVGVLDEPPVCRIKASRVILAMPPRLAARSILFTPDLPTNLTQAMLRANTWMAGHAKFFALYDEAAWRTMGLSGQGFSYHGPVGEIHDGSCETGTPFGLTGFLATPALRRKEKEAMAPAMVSQLGTLFGDEAAHPTAFYYKDWAKEPFTATEYDLKSAHNHPEFHLPSGKTTIWDNRFHFAGTETADHLAGYLEGALASGERAASAVSRPVRDSTKIKQTQALPPAAR